MKIILANPRGFCAGVDRAIDIVKAALEKFGAPIYVRHEVVHNRFVVEDLKSKGAIFVDELHQIPDNAIVIFSAHGISQQVRQEAAERNLTLVLDATCPLVTKVHLEVMRASRSNQECVLIGHAGHAEVEGTLGQYDNQQAGIYLVETLEDVSKLTIKNPDSLSYVTQTTLSVDDTKYIRVSDEILKRTSDAYRRIRNTARFLLANLHDFEPEKHSVEPEKLLALDAWIVREGMKLQQSIIQAYEAYQFHQIYHELHNFCVRELGGFYLDIIKDRQYTLPKNSLARRSAQTAMHYLIQAMVRWIAPILTFTAEELWQHLPSVTASSVFLTEWATFPSALNHNHSDVPDELWGELIVVRETVNKAIEQKRAEGAIGGNLEADITLFVNAQMLSRLTLVESELRFVFITSSVTLVQHEQPEMRVEVNKTTEAKCARCWHHLATVDKTPEYPGICHRCVTNITTEAGEHREYA